MAAPQLAHLLFVIFNTVALFALLSYLGLGQRVPYASSCAAAFEETFSSLLGLGYVKMPDVFPANFAQSPPQILLSLIIFYGREALFVMVLMQFFTTTLSAQFMELKALAATAKASSIPKDLAEHVLPELRSKAAAALRRAKQLRLLRKQQAVSPVRSGSDDTAGDRDGRSTPAAAAAGPSSAAGAGGKQRELDASAGALMGFLKAHYPDFVSSKAFGDQLSAISVGNHYLDLDAMQQLFVQLTVQQTPSTQILLQTPPARTFTHQAANAAASEADSTAAAAAAALLPLVGQAAVEAGAPAAAVAAALTAAEQLMGSCGVPVDLTQLQQGRLDMDQLGQVDVAQLQDDEAAGGLSEAPPGLRPGQDYTVEVRGAIQPGSGSSLLGPFLTGSPAVCGLQAVH